MAAAVKTCRVCGKRYEACRTVSNLTGVFRWQEVACSPECGAEYLRRVTEARSHGQHKVKPDRARHRANPVAGTVEPVDCPAMMSENQAQAETFFKTSEDNA